MFKGLKSKLEDEAKRLQATVSQYGESIANQVKTAASDVGSERGGRNAIKNDSLSDFRHEQDVLAGLEPQASSHFVLSRERRQSNDSKDSGESLLTIHVPKPSAHVLLDSISETESNFDGATEDLNNLESTSNEQLVSLVQRLNKKCITYKKRFMALKSGYIELHNENDKCKELHVTREKALHKIERLKKEVSTLLDQQRNSDESLSERDAKIKTLQNLLEKCKEEIKSNRQKISTLTETNHSLQSSNGPSDNTVERLNAEWKGKFDKQEEEWTKRFSTCDEKASLALATMKADMHSTLNLKDVEIQKWIEKFHTLEQKELSEEEKYQTKINDLKNSLANIERNNSENVKRLVDEKDQCVKLLKADEDKRHRELEEQHAIKLKQELETKETVYKQKLEELGGQLQMSIESNEMFKVGSSNQQGLILELQDRISQLQNENDGLKAEVKSATEISSSNVSNLRTLNDAETQFDSLLDGSEFPPALESNAEFVEMKERTEYLVESLNAKERESFLDKETIEKLENELLSEREKNIELKSIESLFDQRTQELKNSLGSNNVLERELQSEKSRVEILLTNIDGVNNKNNKLEQELKDSIKKYDQIVLLHKQDLDELEKCREKMNEITTRLRNVSTEKDSLSIQNEEYLGQAMEELQQQSEKVVQLTNLKSKNETEIVQLRNELAKANEEVVLTANELGSLQKQLQALNESNEKTKTENERIALELDSIKRGNDFDCATSQLEKLGSELESLRIQNESVLLDNNSLKTRLSEFELQNQTLSSISADIQDLQNQLASKEQKVCELQDDLEDRVQKIQELTDSLHKLENEKQLFNEELINLREAENQCRMDNNLLKEKLFEFESSEKKMSLETDAMLKQLQAEKDRNANELNEKINALSQELSKASRLLEDQKALHSDELGIMQKENDEVNARLNVMTEEICHFKSHDSDIVLERNEAIQKYEEIVSSFEKLKEVIAANVKEIANLEHDKKELSNKIKLFEEEKSTLLAEITSNNGALNEFKVEKRSFEENYMQLLSTQTKLEAECTSLNAKIAELEKAHRLQIVELQKEANESHQKSTTDFQNQLLNLQNEIRQLYSEVNEKNHLIDDQMRKITELEVERQTSNVGNNVVKTMSSNISVESDMDMEELQKKLQESEAEVSKLREELTGHENKVYDWNAENIHSSRRKSNSQSKSSFCCEDAFSEPTEAEYLRNILFRYMSERESLGKDIITLARVIGTVVRFSHEQLESILKHEEARLHHGFLGGSMLSSSSNSHH